MSLKLEGNNFLSLQVPYTIIIMSYMGHIDNDEK